MAHAASGLRRALTFLLLLVAVARDVAAETHARPTAAVPGTVLIARELQPSVEAMLRRSPTFRRQYERLLAAPMLVVTARIDINVMHKTFRARSGIRRYDSGLIVVSMVIAPDAVRPEWIAHEFEHVLEQIEGVNVVALARRRRPGSWFSSGDMIETVRATKAGHVVRDEMRARR